MESQNEQLSNIIDLHGSVLSGKYTDQGTLSSAASQIILVIAGTLHDAHKKEAFDAVNNTAPSVRIKTSYPGAGRVKSCYLSGT